MARVEEQRLPEDAGREIPVEMEKTYRLLALVRGQTFARPKYVEGDEVMVWPDLVVIEAISALVFTLLLMAMSILVDAPLLQLANPTVTPNPSKAPWYFLNLQELLLHMDASLAGVFVPGIALVLLAAIPYIDKSPLGQGVYWYSPNSKRIARFAAIYSFILVCLLIIIDEPPREHGPTLGFWPGFGVSVFFGSLRTRGIVPDFPDLPAMGDPYVWFYSFLIPVVVMVGLSALLVSIVRRRWRADMREVMIALFTAFVVAFVVLTISGTAFRGHGMELDWPWNHPRFPEGGQIVTWLGL
jgi:quinol-cytochrome oxidoreductase complex cytochrome b subunit